MKNIIILSMTVLLLIVSSCKKDEASPLEDYFGFDTYEEAVNNLGSYIHYFDVVEGGIYIQATKQLNTDILKWQIGATFRESITSQSSSDGGTYYINEHEFTHNGTSYTLNNAGILKIIRKKIRPHAHAYRHTRNRIL